MRVRVVHRIAIEAEESLIKSMGEEEYNNYIKKEMLSSLFDKLSDNMFLLKTEVPAMDQNSHLSKPMFYEWEFKGIFLNHDEFDKIKSAINVITENL